MTCRLKPAPFSPCFNCCDRDPMLTFKFDGEPVPAMRARVTQNGTYTPAKYRQYKRRLAQALASNFPHLVQALSKNERAKVLKKVSYSLDIIVCRSRATGDIDNFLKTVMDALQDSGIILNDKQITKSSQEIITGTEPPAVLITLNER